MKNKMMFLCVLLLSLAFPTYSQHLEPRTSEVNSKGKTLYVDFSETEFSALPPVVVITKASVFDFQCIPNPGNPPAGNVRLYCDSGTNQLTTITSGGTVTPIGGTGTAKGPVINVTNSSYAGGAASSNADNNAQFTAAVAAAVAATNSGVSSPGTVGFSIAGSSASSGNVASQAVTVALVANTTTLVWVADSFGRLFTVTDTGGTTYARRGSPVQVVGGTWIQVYASPIGATHASTSVTASQGGGAEFTSVSVSSYTSVTGLNTAFPIISASATTALTTTQPTTKTGGSIVSGCAWWNNNTSTFSATSGTARTITGASATSVGILAMDSSSVPLASLTNSGTLSASTNWACINVELQVNGSSAQSPTLYIPPGNYTYSGGLNLTVPMTLECDPGAVLNYTGSAHAVDIGANNLTGAPFSYQWPFYIDGCTFTGGANMTQGIFWNRWTIIGGIRNSFFHNFGPQSTGSSSPWMIAGQCDQWDLEVGPQNRFVSDDQIPRNVLRVNLGSCDPNSFLRFHDSEVYCLYNNNGSGCPASVAGIGVWTDGDQNRIVHNNFAFMNPDIVVGCSANPCYGTVISGDIIDMPSSAGAGTIVSPIQFQGNQQSLNVHFNTFDQPNNGTAQSVIGPIDGAATLQGARINYNQSSPFPTSTAFVQLNNLVGQTNNQSSNNLCATTYGGVPAPCLIPHTTGSNISNFTFNVDDQHVAGFYGTTTNCSSSASPAVCGASAAGSVAIANPATTIQVNSTAVTANSQIIVLEDSSLGTKLGVTCNTTTGRTYTVSARTAATSFTITASATPAANSACLSYWIIN